jgi:hypothetical protein
MPFREVPVKNDGGHIPRFLGPTFLEFRTTDTDFNPLPRRVHFVNIYCVLLGGEALNLKVTFSAFCAETEMSKVLKIKAATNGLSTDRLDGRNCVIHTGPLLPHNHEVVVSIGHET